jgi:hypothetical protein
LFKNYAARTTAAVAVTPRSFSATGNNKNVNVATTIYN